MRSVITVGSLVLLLSAPLPIALAQSSPRVANDGAALENEKAAILEVIERQSTAFWAKDFQRWADTWVHADYVRRVGWSQAGGVSSIEGWEAIGARMKKSMADNPKPNLTPAKLVRARLNFRIYGDVAWVTFQQRGVDTGEPRFDMPGLSYETRMFEKHDGKWKVVYLGYVLEEKRDTQPGR
jgi:SnoaL-like protein